MAPNRVFTKGFYLVVVPLET